MSSQQPPSGRDRVERHESCSHCAKSRVSTVMFTHYVVYMRCGSCSQVWRIPKPGAAQLGAALPPVDWDVAQRDGDARLPAQSDSRHTFAARGPLALSTRSNSSP